MQYFKQSRVVENQKAIIGGIFPLRTILERNLWSSKEQQNQKKDAEVHSLRPF